MTATNNASLVPTNKKITKIITFYEDGTFSEFSPSPGYTPSHPYVSPQYHPWPAPWWQNGPVSIPASQMWGVANAGTSKDTK